MVFIVPTAFTDRILEAGFLDQKLVRPTASNGIPVPEAIGIGIVTICLLILMVGTPIIVGGKFVKRFVSLLEREVHKRLHLLGFPGSLFVTKLTGLPLIDLTVANAEFAVKHFGNQRSLRESDKVTGSIFIFVTNFLRLVNEL